MRVIAGVAGGRRLRAPKGKTARPTSDRVREALFSSLGTEVVGAVVLDLFAGTGALGIEALSRGAASATFVERNAGVATVLSANVESTGLATQARIQRTEAATFVRRPTGGPFTLVFCDPPYDEPLPDILDLLTVLNDHAGLVSGARVVVERDRRDPDLGIEALVGPQAAEGGRALVGPQAAEGGRALVLAVERQRSYGDTVLLFYRAKEG